MDHKTLSEALAAFQAEAPTVPKGKTAKVPTKSGGSYSYSYADLADVAAAAYPLLSKHGLSFSCCPRATEHGYELVGILLHACGEKLEGALPLHGNDPQQIGAALTYARRYLLGSVTGIVTDDDTDGAFVQPDRVQNDQRDPWAEPSPASSSEMISDPQMKLLNATLRDLGLTDRDEAHAQLTGIVGHELLSARNLTKREASQVIDHLRGLLGKS